MIFLLFFLAPMAVAAVIQYLCCRLPRRREWRWLPVAITLVLAALGVLYRSHEWGEGVPLETLLFFPGLPALGLLCGCALGYRLWKKIWTPRIK